MKKALVTGGAGFIGSHLTRRLLSGGVAVRVLDDFSTGSAKNLTDVSKNVELLEGSICDESLTQRACAGVDVVFHVAARASVPRSVAEPLRSNEVNVTGSLNVLVAARDQGVSRVVYSASSSAYGDTPVLPKIESMSPMPLSPYAVSKLAAEQYCRAFSQCYGLQTLCLRYFNVFGPRQDPNSQYAAVIPAFVTRILAGQRPIVFGDGEQTRDFCYIDNVIDANLLAAAAPHARGEAMNIACGERTTLNRIVELINRHLGTSVAAEYRAARSGDVRDSLAALGEAERLIQYRPKVMFGEGLSRTIAWYREQAS